MLDRQEFSGEGRWYLIHRRQQQLLCGQVQVSKTRWPWALAPAHTFALWLLCNQSLLQFSSVQFSRSVTSDSLRPREHIILPAIWICLIQEQERPGMDWMERNSQDHFKALIDAEFFHSASYTKYQNKPPSHIKYNFQANSF